jgi:Outer membrane protein beta-barrel domain
MKFVSKEAALTAITAICMGLTAYAQTNVPKYEFGANLGFLVYQGDLTPEKLGSFKTQKLALGLHAGKILSSSFSVRANLAFGKLKGDDAKYANPEFRQQRNFNFTSPVFEVSGQLVWNPLNRNYADKGFSPYLFAGAGLSLLRIKRDWSNINTTYFNPEVSEIWAGLAADSAHKLPRILPIIPIGAGVNYFFSSKLGVNAETTYRISTTDYLDGFSQAANPDKKDNYLGYSVGIIYRTGKKNRLDCPVIRY